VPLIIRLKLTLIQKRSRFWFIHPCLVYVICSRFTVRFSWFIDYYII